MHDPYVLSAENIKEPPQTFAGRLKFLGPGFILSASIVGSGELIATSTLGATAGFHAFWIIVISCLAKVAVQLEFGKHTILTGRTAMQCFNGLPGLRIGRSHWSIWVILTLILLKIIQLGGMIGSTAIVLNLLAPNIPLKLWLAVISVSLSLLLFKGFYSVVERSSLIMTVSFTVLTIGAVAALAFTPYAITLDQFLSGFALHFSPEIVTVAIGAFGITGVASDEIIAYNYWCLEKGYATYTGPRDDSADWNRRARGWVRVMYLDAIVAMIIYTSVTAAFYLLGAAVLHARGVIPQGNELIEAVALIYTESLGPGIRIAYLVGAFFVLYSSLFASLAAWSRMYSDIFGQVGWINFYDISLRKRLIAILAWVCPPLWVAAFLFVSLPVVMILFGGIVGSILLLIIVYAALNFRYRQFQLEPPGVLYDSALWFSIVSICFVGLYGIWNVVFA
ncbi:Nramp family divalent metal transporter [Chryseolinea sp. T2]|uniref:Nramp family divalent metal transporter n=1 Tax=Chryseolinea sp. T2 TaxID=3129255 RepID=UPI003077463F